MRRSILAAGRRFAPSVLASLLLFIVSTGAFAQAPSDATIVGTAVDVASGLALSRADVVLFRSNARVAATTTDANGRFQFDNQPAAFYRIEVRLSGYGGAASDDVVVAPGATRVTVAVSLTRTGGSEQQQLRTIGRTSTSRTGGGLQRTSTVSEDLTTQTMFRENYANVGEAITVVPGVFNTGHSSTIGDDTAISLRGFDPSESQTLLDGHPIGPIGIGAGGYNFQVSPFFVLSNTQVTFGAGALGLYGTDATGGAIDLQTISPTREREISIAQGFGTQGKLLSAMTATGTVGRLGYAVGGATQGLYGNFAPGVITQTGNLGFDVSPGNVAANTHTVSGNYSLRDALLKVQYTLLPGTVATITGYTAHSRDDKSGVGDNDYQPYGPELAIAQGVASQPNGGPSGTACGVGFVGVTVDNAGTIACQTPAVAARGSYGPSGGGPNPFQDIVNQDYHGRLTTNFLGNSLAIDGYIDTYNLNYNRNQASQDPKTGRYTGGFNQNLYKTTGFLVSDDIVRGKNDFGLGYFTQHQTYYSNQFDTGNLVIVPNPPAFLASNSLFMRDTYTPAPWMTLYTNIYYKLLSTTGADTVDPRATLLLRPTPNDVVRLVAGKTDGEPGASLVQTQFNNTPSNINPSGSCSSLIGLPSNTNTAPGQIGVGTLGATGLQQETATDYEVTYGHRSTNGSSFQLGGYVMRAANLVTNVSVPVAAGQIPDNLLQAYYNRIQQSCGSSYVGTIADLSLSQAINGTTSGLYRGITLTGRAVATRNIALNFAYALTHAQTFGYSDADLTNNASAINGGQQKGVPLNSGSLGVEYDNHHGLDARIDGYYYGINNGYNRPPYGFANLGVSYRVPKTGTEFTVGVNNLTQSAYQKYGYFNAGVTPPVNAFNANQAAVGTEEFGLPARQILFTLTQHVR